MTRATGFKRPKSQFYNMAPYISWQTDGRGGQGNSSTGNGSFQSAIKLLKEDENKEDFQSREFMVWGCEKLNKNFWSVQ